MKNVKDYQLKKAIFMELWEFKSLINFLFEDNVEIEVTFDGLDYMGTDDIITSDEVIKILSEHFEVTVTSVHHDSFTPVGIWIVYKD